MRPVEKQGQASHNIQTSSKWSDRDNLQQKKRNQNEMGIDIKTQKQADKRSMTIQGIQTGENNNKQFNTISTPSSSQQCLEFGGGSI